MPGEDCLSVNAKTEPGRRPRRPVDQNEGLPKIKIPKVRIEDIHGKKGPKGE